MVVSVGTGLLGGGRTYHADGGVGAVEAWPAQHG